jgi:hypothetical protein
LEMKRFTILSTEVFEEIMDFIPSCIGFPMFFLTLCLLFFCIGNCVGCFQSYCPCCTCYNQCYSCFDL